MSDTSTALKLEDWRLKSAEDLTDLQQRILEERDPVPDLFCLIQGLVSSDYQLICILSVARVGSNTDADGQPRLGLSLGHGVSQPLASDHSIPLSRKGHNYGEFLSTVPRYNISGSACGL